VSTLVTIARLPELTWLSPLDVLFAAEDKLAQQAACRALGIAVPPTVLVTRPHRIPTELGEWLVVKPMAAGHFRDATGVGRVVHATEMHRSDERLELLAGAPFLVQERVRARMHLRVVTVDRQAWVCELDAADLPLDWRADEAAHSSFTPASRPTIASKALELAQRLQLGYSSQDWVIDLDGSASFLDLNPAGQWLFLPPETAGQATTAIANWLAGSP
jgi:phosphoribosylaminoimidazole carboxylase (NCAIR synthetase)